MADVSRVQMVSVRLSDAEIERLRRLAEREERSLSSMVRVAIRAMLKEAQQP